MDAVRLLVALLWGLLGVSASFLAASPVAAGGDHGRVCRANARVVEGVQYARIEGADPDELSLDLHLPPTGKACRRVPVVIGVHGGAWMVGDKRGFTGDKARLFTEQGWAFANVNYRLSRRGQDPPVRYPMHNEDVARAVKWVVDHADEYGLDTDRVGIMGHSAGAQIVASIATDEHYLEDVALGLETIACAFPNDTEGFDVAARINGGGPGARLYAFIFGTDPVTQRAASPITHVEPGKAIPPMLLVRRGSASRIAQVEAFAEALRDAGVDVEIIDARGYTHMEVNDVIGSTTDRVMTDGVTNFFAECFA